MHGTAAHRRSAWMPMLLLLCLLGPTVTGCGGCTQSPAARAKLQQEEERKKKAEALKKKEKKKELEISRPAVEPHDETPRFSLKRGHWGTATQRMKANLDDFVGELTVSMVDKKGRPLDLDRTPYRLVSKRPVALAKGRSKTIATSFFTPTTSPDVSVESKLRNRGGMTTTPAKPAAAVLMAPYQYHWVVLAKNPAKYTYIKTLDVVSFPNGGAGGSEGDDDTHYIVVLPNVVKRVPLPDNPLAWTTIAYVLWDELEPDRLSLEQRDALVDWLHWGGQLIVSGPDSLGLLRGSFLEAYLPAAGGDSVKISQDQLDLLTAEWTPKSAEKRIGPLAAAKPWSGIALEPKAGSSAVPGTGRLLLEKHVGRGRVVISAFQLDEPDFINWKAIGGFYNACLLRRPSRQWSAGEFDERLNWANVPERRLDAALTSGVRFFSRDVGVATNYQRSLPSENDPSFQIGRDPRGFGGAYQEPAEWKPPADALGGVAAWNDFSKTASTAREILIDASKVKVPPASFVLLSLTVYLIALVPLNWLFFHALGRVEWAWIAAPIIAIAGTMAVVWQAQLDIGFVRARTDIAIIETQGNHPRAHLTRYTAVYTSLGTTYDFRFDSLTAQAQPFPASEGFELLKGQTRTDVIFRKHEDVRLTGLGVSSNTTSMVHSEQIVDMERSIYLGTSSSGNKQIVNGSPWDLRSVAIVHRPVASSEKLEGCWIGSLAASTSATIGFSQLGDGLPFARERAEVAAADQQDHFSFGHLAEVALGAENIEPGETRLVGRVDGVLPGLTIAPTASQTHGVALVVAHLDYGSFPAPQPDVNCRTSIVESNTQEEERNDE